MKMIGHIAFTLIASANIITAEMNAFQAIIKPIGQNNVSGTAVVMTMTDGSLFYGGTFSGLKPNLSNCMAENGCGVHIHAGTGCEDTTSQGAHLYENLDTDPWQTAQYVSDAGGKALVGNSIRIGTMDVAGRAFVVHDEDGSRIGCGILEVDASRMTAYMHSLNNTPGQGGEVMTVSLDETICFAGSASGLSHHSMCNPSETQNGCGAHVHSGTSCENTDTQGGHLYGTPEDPWALVGYSTTSGRGNTIFGDCVYIGSSASEALSKPFIVHEQDGSRAICGLLKRNSNEYSPNTIAWIVIPLVLGFILFVIIFQWKRSKKLCLVELTSQEMHFKTNYTDDPQGHKKKETDFEVV